MLVSACLHPHSPLITLINGPSPLGGSDRPLSDQLSLPPQMPGRPFITHSHTSAGEVIHDTSTKAGVNELCFTSLCPTTGQLPFIAAVRRAPSAAAHSAAPRLLRRSVSYETLFVCPFCRESLSENVPSCVGGIKTHHFKVKCLLCIFMWSINIQSLNMLQAV